MKAPNIAVIGAGDWGKFHIRNLAEMGHLAAICDANEKRATELGAHHGVAVRDLQSILNDRQIEGLVIATPAITHASLGLQALAHNKHVLIEKPMAVQPAEGRALLKAAQEKERVLMCGHLLLYHPAIIEMQRLITDGALGELLYLQAIRTNLGKVRSEENVLWSFAPHDISMLLALTGKMPQAVSCEGSSHIISAHADTATLNMQFNDGLSAQVFTSWMHPEKERRVVVIGSKAMLVFDDTQDWSKKLQRFDHTLSDKSQPPVWNRAAPQTIPLKACEPLREELNDFIHSIQNQTTPKANATEALQVLEVLSKAQASMDQRQLHQDFGADVMIHPSSYIDADVRIGKGTKIWHFCHVLGDADIGENVNIGQNVMIGGGVKIGNGCKIQNNVSVYSGVTLDEDVFCGPSCVFTNVRNPRAHVNRRDEFTTTRVKRGATIGANATIICGNTLGAYCLVGAGAVVTKDVPDHALVVGNPARQTGWVSHAGEVLGGDLICPRTQEQYALVGNSLQKASQQGNKQA